MSCAVIISRGGDAEPLYITHNSEVKLTNIGYGYKLITIQVGRDRTQGGKTDFVGGRNVENPLRIPNTIINAIRLFSAGK